MRGLDVLALVPSEYLSKNEIAAAAMADQGAVFNPQQQFRVTWPADPVVARAYLDQLERSKALSASSVADLDAALDRAAKRLRKGKIDEDLAARLEALAAPLAVGGGDAVTTTRRTGLAEVLNGIAARLR